MNEREKSGCKDILSFIQTEELLSLTDTVTKKLITVSNRTEAISAVITYSESAYQLLTRKKIKRDLLFKYLVDKGIVLSVNADKKTIIRKLLETWGTKNVADLMKDYDEEVPSSSSSEDFTKSPQQSEAYQTALAVPSNNTCQSFRQTIPQSEAYQTALAVPSNNTCQSSRQSIPDLQILGETFASWFYKVLNSNNPDLGVSPEEFGPCHFWDEAKLLLLTLTDIQNMEEHSGSQLVSEKLLSFTKQERLLFNPNISKEGVFVKAERHGLVVVLVCGTIHRQNQHLGVFDQMFGLVKDPRFNDNWKIKLTKLKLQNVPVDHVPCLKDKPECEIKDLVSV